MNITIIIGWVISFGLVLFGIFNGGQIDWFIDTASLAITVGGTIGCLIGSFPLSYLKNLPKYLKLAILPKKFNPQSYIEQIVEFAKIARTILITLFCKKVLILIKNKVIPGRLEPN